MKVTPMDRLPEVLLIRGSVFSDARGSFTELFQQDRFSANGVSATVAQVNHSHSTRNVLRGLHYQQRHPQGKLVTVVQGEVFDVAVDVRRASRTFGEWTGMRLASGTGEALWIPPGFAHGFCVLSETADVIYTCSSPYVAEDDRGVLWSDPSIGIDWPVREPVLSPRDTRNAPLHPGRDDLPSALK